MCKNLLSQNTYIHEIFGFAVHDLFDVQGYGVMGLRDYGAIELRIYEVKALFGYRVVGILNSVIFRTVFVVRTKSMTC